LIACTIPQRVELGEVLVRPLLQPVGQCAASAVPGRQLEVRVDAFAALGVVFGDAPVLPADPRGSHRAIEDTVRQVLAAARFR
jgi:hypothetical protein